MVFLNDIGKQRRHPSVEIPPARCSSNQVTPGAPFICVLCEWVWAHSECIESDGDRVTTRVCCMTSRRSSAAKAGACEVLCGTAEAVPSRQNLLGSAAPLS